MKIAFKKAVLVIVIAMSLALSFTSCSKKTEIVDPTNQNGTNDTNGFDTSTFGN